MKTKKIAYIGLMIALAFVFSYIEFLLPIHIGIPGDIPKTYQTLGHVNMQGRAYNRDMRAPRSWSVTLKARKCGL